MAEGELVERLRGESDIISVGDVVSLALLQNGLDPHLLIYDCQTERVPMVALQDCLRGRPGRYITVANPPGLITPQLVQEIEEAIGESLPTRIRVEGEEDLAALVCAALASDGSCLVYGLPRQGMALVIVDPAVRDRAIRLIYSMEELN
jgi:uncharacterized protein (UPF0218 family)